MSDAAQIHDKARGLYRVATIFEWVAIVAGGLGILGGLLVAASSDKTNGANGTTTTHPSVALGLTLMLGAVLNAALLWAIARALVVFAMDVNSRHSDVPIAVVGMRSFGPSTTGATPAPSASAAASSTPAARSAAPPPTTKIYRRQRPSE